MAGESVIQLGIILCKEKKVTSSRGIAFIATVTVLAAAAIFHPTLAYAESMEPRAYSNAPVGMNFFMLGYAYQQGDVLLDPSVPLKDVKVEIHSTFMAYSRSLDVFGKSGNIAVVVPYAWLSGSGTVNAQERNRKVSGFSDPVMRFAVNLCGAPALSLEEFKNYRQDTILGVSLLVTMPLGQYDSTKLANIGTNRWSFKPEVGVSQALGRWTLEAIAGVFFYTGNDDFFGGNTREQEPVCSLQSHVIYNFPTGIWAAIGANYYYGGRSSINGVKGNDLQSNWRLGTTLAVPVNHNHSVKLYGNTGLHARSGENYNLVGIAWQYRWGGGF